MSIVMSERIRLVLIVDDEIRAALRLEAAKQDTEMSEIAMSLFREGLAESLNEVRRRKAREAKQGRQDA